MEQKNSLMRYLKIGIIISCFTFTISCKDYFYNQIGEFEFVNNTSYNITYSAGYEDYDIAPKSKILITQNFSTAGRKNGAIVTDYRSPVQSYTAVLTIKFNNLKCLIDVKENDVNSIRDINSFVPEKIGANHFKFTFTFTEADYNRAVACQ